MDERDKEKKRVLTPPADWADGLRPTKVSTNDGEVEKSEWPADDSFEVPPHTMDSEGGQVATKPTTNSASEMGHVEPTMGDAAATERPSKLPWILTLASLLLAGGLWLLWSNEKSSSETEITALKNTIRSMKRAENKQKTQIKNNAFEAEALRSQIRSLEEQISALSPAQKSQSTNTLTIAPENDSAQEKPASPESGKVSIKPPSQTGGDWFVNLESHRSGKVAEERLAALRSDLLPMNISVRRAEVDGKIFYRIGAAGFSSKNEAATASDWIANTLQAGPYWVGKNSRPKQPKSEPPKKAVVLAPLEPEVATQKNTTNSKPVQLRSFTPKTDRWFIYVDTYDSERTANILIKELKNRGLNAVSSVEARLGELFYSVHIVDIPTQASGNIIAGQLRDGGFTNARMKKQIN